MKLTYKFKFQKRAVLKRTAGGTRGGAWEPRMGTAWFRGEKNPPAAALMHHLTGASSGWEAPGDPHITARLCHALTDLSQPLILESTASPLPAGLRAAVYGPTGGTETPQPPLAFWRCSSPGQVSGAGLLASPLGMLLPVPSCNACCPKWSVLSGSPMGASWPCCPSRASLVRLPGLPQATVTQGAKDSYHHL